ncbi:hypothetical protein C0992_005145 [Termitomyces sp. T32_za158]|nr:hypothetical protein C0992_005145 [Termitomyces sp. T32_za158]
MRNDAVAARSIIDPETYEEQNQFQREIAEVLRKNIVQGVRATNVEGARKGQETFKLRLTKDTELGSNDTIKNPPPMKRSDRSLRRQEKAAQEHHTSVTDVAPHNDSFAFFSPSHLSMNFSQLKKARRDRVVPELKEEDLDETFVRGSGPGGQSINKSENNVQLLHKPTGIRVACHETRSLKLNRLIARKNLLEKVLVLPSLCIYGLADGYRRQLDKLANPGLSKAEFSRAKQRERERRRKKKAKKKAADKAFEAEEEEEEDLDDDLDKIEPQEIAREVKKETEELQQRL